MDAALPSLIQHMLQPEFYDHPVQSVQIIQTHISFVLLTGEIAYKVKKPIRFGFLDFTTLEKRHYFCQEELRLNRRLCPDLYLEVKAIVKTGDRYAFAKNPVTDFAIVEYAVQMRQFPQKGLFSYLFESGQLTPALVQQLGISVANFHASTQTSAEICEYGSCEAIQRVDANNFNISKPYIGRAQTQQQYDETRAFSADFFQRHHTWFRQRQLDEKIRECHGDLHLNNVCIDRDQIQIFDCIEFNQDFRNIDVIYDAAFMIMDLEFHGRADLANLFLNVYLEHTGDYWSAALLPLYLTMRATIRGNVHALLLDDLNIGEVDKGAALQRSQDYYRLAWRYTQRPTGQLMMMSGLSGSGKSTVARQLAQQLGAIVIRSDAVRKRLAGIPLQTRGDYDGAPSSGIYTPEMTQLTYDRLLELGLFLAQQGWSVILDAKYDRQALRQSVLEGAAAAQLDVRIVQCTAPVEVLRHRLRHRTGDIADATADLLDGQIQMAEPLTETEASLAAVLETTEPLAAQLSAFGTVWADGPN